MIMPHLFDLKNKHKDESNEWILLNMCIEFINPKNMGIKYGYFVKSHNEEIRSDMKEVKSLLGFLNLSVIIITKKEKN